MSVIVIFVALVVVGDAISVGIASIVEGFSEFAGLITFLGLFISVFIVAWLLAVEITERYVLRIR